MALRSLGRLLLLLAALTLPAMFCSTTAPGAEDAPKAEQPTGAAYTPAADAKEVDDVYLVILIDGKRIGYGRELREVAADGTVTSSVWNNITLNRGPISMDVRTRRQEITDAAGRLVRFVHISDSSGAQKRITGRLDGNTLHLEETVAGRVRQWTMEWPKGALTTEAENLLVQRQPRTAGHKYSYKSMDLSEQVVVSVETTVVGEEEVPMLDDSKTKALRKRSSIKRPGMNVMADEFLDKDGNWLRRDVTLMGMPFSQLRTDKATAMKSFTPEDLFTRILVKSPAAIPHDAAAVTIKVRVEKQEGVESARPPTLGPQKVTENDDGTLTLRYELIMPKMGEKLPYSGDDAEVRRYLKPTRTVQSDDEEIIAAARSAIGRRDDAAEAVTRIARWASLKMTGDWQVSAATASEVIRDLRGDCSEYAVLTAAMCRAVGIPARLATGLIYTDEWEGQKDVFAGHAWTQVYVNGQWMDLDATLPAPFRSAGRILLNVPDGEEATNYDEISLLGTLKVISVEVEEKKPAAETKDEPKELPAESGDKPAEAAEKPAGVEAQPAIE